MGKIFGIVALVFFIGGGLLIGGVFISANNTCVAKENSLTAKLQENQNNYDNFWKSVREVSQVPKQYANDNRELYKTVMSARYGKDGSKAVWNWLKESNPQLSPALYERVQVVVEGGRRDFSNNQNVLIDMARDYRTYIGKFPNNLICGVLGYPKVDLNQFKPVTSDRTDNAFETKKDAEVNVFN